MGIFLQALLAPVPLSTTTLTSPQVPRPTTSCSMYLAEIFPVLASMKTSLRNLPPALSGAAAAAAVVIAAAGGGIELIFPLPRLEDEGATLDDESIPLEVPKAVVVAVDVEVGVEGAVPDVVLSNRRPCPC